MRRRPSAVLAVALAAGALLAACASPSGSGDGGAEEPTDETSQSAGEPADGIDDLVGTWELESGTWASGAITPVEDRPVSLGIAAEGTVAGQGGCNGYGGSVTVEDGTIKFSEMISTMMYCDGGVSDVETAFLDALDAVDTASVDGDQLLLTGDDVELHLVRTADEPATS